MYKFPDQHFPSSLCPRLGAVHPLDTSGDLTTCITQCSGSDQTNVLRCQYRNKSRSGLALRSVEPAIPFCCTRIKAKKKQGRKKPIEVQKFSDKDFYGGCLSYAAYPSGGCTGILFHPRTPDLKGLHVVPVRSPSADESDETTCMYATQNPYMEYPLSEHLLQIETTQSTDKGSIIAALRTKTKCHLVNITGKKGKPKLCKSYIIQRKKLRPTNISLSPYIKMESLISYADGSFELRDIDKRVQKITPEWNEAEQSQACWSHFGSHPRLVVAHQPKQLNLFDIRSPFSSSADATCLMALPNDLLARDQEIQVIRQHPANYFYHLVATQDMLVLLDERFPKYHVLQWSHHLHNSPSCINIVNQALPTDDLAIVTSHPSSQSHCLQFSCLDGSTPGSTAPIWKLSSTSCYLDAMSEVPTYGVDDVKSRLCRPLIGSCTAEHTGGKRLSVFQVTDHGDVFQQILSPSPEEDHQDKTAIPGAGSSNIRLSQESEKMCRKWTNEVLMEKMEDTTEKRWGLDEIVTRSSTLEELQQIQPHPDCRVCMPIQDKIRSPKTPRLRDNIRCPACGIPINSTKFTDYLKTRTSGTLDIITSKAAPSSQSSEELPWKRVKYSKYGDAIGDMLRKKWKFDDDEEDVDGDDEDEQIGDFIDQASSQETQTPSVPTLSATAPRKASKHHTGFLDSLSASVPSANPRISLSSLQFPEHLSSGLPRVSLTKLKDIRKESPAMSSPWASQSLSQSSIFSTPSSPQKKMTARRKLMRPNFTMGF